MKKVRGLRWWIISLIGVATIINYVDRSALPVMWPDISRDVGLTQQDYAGILTFFMVAYAIGQAVSGRLFDWLGTRMGFVLCISVWSISCAMHSLARSLLGFGMFRALLGLSEAGNWPGAAKANAEWFPIRERALAQGLFNAGASLGAVISAPLIAFLYILLGWQATFIVVGGIGLLWIIPWWFVNRKGPEEHPWLTAEERSFIVDGRVPPGAVAGADPQSDRYLPMREILGHKQSWSVIVARFFLDPIWWMFVNWLPIYLARGFGFDIKQIGLFAWIPYVGAATGSVVGGWFSGFLIHRGWSVNRARKTAIVAGALIQFPALVGCAFAGDPLLAVGLGAVVLFGYQTTMSNYQTLPSDFFSGKSVGSLAGLGGMSAAAGVLITTWIVPAITATSYYPFFIMGAVLVPLSVFSAFLLTGEIQRVQVDREAR